MANINKSYNSLWVCWKVPKRNVPQDALVLSFATPEADEQIEKSFGNRYLRGSEVSQKVRNNARKFYVNLVARVGATPCFRGKTLRELLQYNKDESSLWWYHKVSYKDNESEPTFDRIIIIMTITYILEKYGINNIVLYGAENEIAGVLGSRLNVGNHESCGKRFIMAKLAHAILSRMKQLMLFLLYINAVKRIQFATDRNALVGLFGYWDWSIKYNGQTKKFDDLYYKGLSDKIRERGICCSHLLWLDPYNGPGSRNRSLRDVLKPLQSRSDAVLLHRHLIYRDVIKHFFDLNPMMIYLRVMRQRPFRDIFVNKGFDFFTLFKNELIYYFMSSDIPYYRLVALATKRAVSKYDLGVLLNFMEFSPIAKAFYDGVNHSGKNAICCCVQHGSRSRESTILAFDRDTEYRGRKDGQSIPRPDYCFAMGELGKRLFKENGFPEGKVILTGSPRFDHIKIGPKASVKHRNRQIVMLFVASGLLNTETQALEAALMAVNGLSFVKLILREHFFYRLQDYFPAKKFVKFIEISNKNLDADLDRADIVLFTSTTVAEEAFLRGKPVWQWVTPNSNSQAFRDIPVVRRFYSTNSLANALEEFRDRPEKFYPKYIDIQFVERACFYKCDGKSAERIAEEISKRFL